MIELGVGLMCGIWAIVLLGLLYVTIERFIQRDG